MSTKRGGKVNVKEQPTIESDVRRIFNPYRDEQPESNMESKPEVFEVDVNKLSEETQEVHYGFIGEPMKEVDVHVNEDVIKELDEMHGVDIIEDVKKIVTESFDEPIKVNIIVEKPKRRIEDLGQSELRLYQRTGIIPQ